MASLKQARWNGRNAQRQGQRESRALAWLWQQAPTPETPSDTEDEIRTAICGYCDEPIGRADWIPEVDGDYSHTACATTGERASWESTTPQSD